MKKTLYIAICGMFIGCASINTTNTIHNREKLKEATSFAYTTSVFDAETMTSNSKRIENFKKYVHFGIDSLFTIDAKKYNISKKITVNKTNTTYVENMFAVDANKVKLPNKLQTLLTNSNEKHVILFSFKPKVGYAFGRFEIVKSSTMEVIIIEVTTGSVIFRDSFYSSNKGINKQLIQNIQKLYRKLNK